MEKKVLAKIGDKEITNLDLENALKTMDQHQAMHFKTDEGKKQLLEDLINQELIYLEAKEAALDEEKEFLYELERVKVNLLKQVAISKILSSVNVIDQEIQDYFKDNKSAFNKPESANAKHILVNSEEKAQEILNKINSGEISFEDAAKEFSTCPSNQSGGDLGTFSKGQMVPEFEEKVFSMNPGEISEPVKTQFGYHLINLNKLIPGGESEYEEVKDEIGKSLLYQKQNQVYGRKISDLKSKYGSLVSYCD